MNQDSERLTEVLHIRVTRTQRERLEALAERLSVKPTDAARVTMGLGLKGFEQLDQEAIHARAAT